MERTPDNLPAVVIRIETPDGACLRRIRVQGDSYGAPDVHPMQLAQAVREELLRVRQLARSAA